MFESRFTPTPEKQMSESLALTKASTAFKAQGRQSRIHWANRFCKDFNDLDYDIKYNLVKDRKVFNAGTHHYKNRIRATSGKSANSAKSPKGVSMDKYKNRFQLIKMNKTINPQHYNIAQNKKYSTLDTQGLCKFEYQKTISGKLKHKSNHHMNFQNQTERSINLNPVWYEPSSQISMQKMMRTINKNKISKCHDFSSYSPRRVFEPKPELDKFYDTKKAKRFATPSTVRQTVTVDKISGRKDPRPKPGTQLTYSQEDARKKLMRRTESHEISKGKRQLEFTKQIISLERGCYR